MKPIYFLFPLFMMGACKTQTGTITSSENTNMEQAEINQRGCPSDGTCTVEVQKNKTLKIQKGGNDEIYPDVVDGENIVVEYNYLKPGPEGTADGNYFETIQFEIPTSTKDLTKEDAALADVNLLFGKHGFRNSAYYKVTDGKLSLHKKGNMLNFTLAFKIDQTPHVISFVQEKVEI